MVVFVFRRQRLACLKHSRFRINQPGNEMDLPGANHRRRMGVNGYFVKFFTSGRRGGYDSYSSSSSFGEKIEDEDEDEED